MIEGVRDLAEDFDAFVAHGAVVIDFWATWCAPCRAMDGVLVELARDMPEVRWGKVEIKQQPALAERFAVRSVPTLILFRKGQPVKTMIGVKNRRQILRALELEDPVTGNA